MVIPFLNPDNEVIKLYNKLFPVSTSEFAQPGELKGAQRKIVSKIDEEDKENIIKLYESLLDLNWVQKTDTSGYISEGISKIRNLYKTEPETALYYAISRSIRMGQYICALNQCVSNKKSTFKGELKNLQGNYFPDTTNHRIFNKHDECLSNYYENNEIFKFLEKILFVDAWMTKTIRNVTDEKFMYSGSVRDAIYHSYLEPKYITEDLVIRVLIVNILLFSVKFNTKLLADIRI